MHAHLMVVVLALAPLAASAAESRLLWQIGSPDGNNQAFALAPKDYDRFQQDGFFVVGLSNARTDWPYVHPGPNDGWAGGQPHTFTIVFGLPSAPTAGDFRFVLDMVDTQSKTPPGLRVDVNGTAFDRRLPAGAGDASIHGQPGKGKAHRLELPIPAKLLKQGNNQIAITSVSGSWFLYGRVALEGPAGVKIAPVANADKLSWPKSIFDTKVKQVIVVFKTHFDIGYTDMACNIVTKYRTTMIDQALGVVDQNRDLPASQQFVWTIPGWPMHKILEDWPGQTVERQKRIRDAFHSGRFVVHGLPFTTHTESLEPEDLVRSLGYSSRLSRGAGLPLPRDGKMTDVPEHTQVLATILARAGIEFMHIGCNGASAPLGVPPLYWWEGPDGSRVLTMYSAQYGTGLNPPRDWPYQTWLALIHTGDNHGPPRPDEVKKLLDRAAKQMPGVKIRIGRLSDFADAIRAEKPELPVVRGDATDTWIHGPMSDPVGMRIARQVRPRIAATESLNTLLRGWGVAVPDASPVVAAAYEQSLLYGEHTWGGSIGWLKNKLDFGEAFQQARADGRYQRSEASWAEHTAYIEKARDLIEPALAGNVQALARGAGLAGPRIVVYNPLPWARDGAIAVDGKRYRARQVPAMGYRAYKLSELTAVDQAPLAGGNVLENEFFRITCDAAEGTIQSLIDKRTGHEMVEAGFGRLLYERFDSTQIEAYCAAYNRRRHVDFEKPGIPPAGEAPYRAASPKGFRALSGAGEVALQANPGDGVPFGVTLRVLLPAGQPYVELEIAVRDKPLEPWPEAGWLCLPFKVDSAQFRLGRPGGIIDPARDIVPGANRDIFLINTAVAIRDPAGQGTAFCPIDHPLVSLDRPGCWRYSTDFVPRKPAAYVNLFNNQWNTNFRLWNGGSWTSRVRIWPLSADNADFVSPALEARYPLEAAQADGPAGPLPVAQSGIELSRAGALVTAFGPNPDGPGTLLRIWELLGKAGEFQVRLPLSLKCQAAQPVDLRGRPAGKPVPIVGGRLAVPLAPFAPASYVLR